MKYEVNLTNKETGATMTIDAFYAPEGYTAEQYIKDSKKNAWDSWNEMLEDKNNEVTLIAIKETPTIKEIVESTGMTQTAFAKHFQIPLRTVQNWINEKRHCAEYVRKMIVKILESEEKEKKLIKTQFEQGDGINYIVGKSKYIRIYAKCKVPCGFEEDYGYLTMKEAILQKLTEEEKKNIIFWYDGQEHLLEPDAKANCEVMVDITRAIDSFMFIDKD